MCVTDGLSKHSRIFVETQQIVGARKGGSIHLAQIQENGQIHIAVVSQTCSGRPLTYSPSRMGLAGPVAIGEVAKNNYSGGHSLK